MSKFTAFLVKIPHIAESYLKIALQEHLRSLRPNNLMSMKGKITLVDHALNSNHIMYLNY